MKHATLLFLRRNNQVLLAMKKRGFGADRWNGVGGKIEPNESILEALKRECQEEIGVLPDLISKVAHLTFTFPNGKPDWQVHTFVSDSWQGEPAETEEMAPKWFEIGSIPYDQMWQDDIHWLPHVLDGKKVAASFAFDDQENLLSDSIQVSQVSALL